MAGAGVKTNESNGVNNQIENFCVFNVLCVLISFITILADLTTDVLVFVEYCKDGFFYWSISTLVFILTPNIIINTFSMKWLVTDKKANVRHWILHGCLSGTLERYVIFLRNGFLCPSLEANTQKLTAERNDLSLLHFLYIFTGTIPQIILQIFSVLTLDGNYYTKVISLVASNASVIWGCATYIYSIMTFTSEKFQWISFTLKVFWHLSMLLARVWGILLFTIIFGAWTLLLLGLHWAAMSVWIVIQNTTFCPNKLEETLYNIVMGFVYCFCYINLREGHTRYRLLLFYTFMVTQNFGSLFLYILLTDFQRQEKNWSICATICIIAGTISGVCAMIFYYRYFHAKGPILWKISNNEDVELNNKVTSNKINTLKHARSFKTNEKQTNHHHDTKRYDTTQTEIKLQHASASKNVIQDNSVTITGSAHSTSVNNGCFNGGMEFYYKDENNLVEKTSGVNHVTICSPTELTLKLSSLENIESSIDEITTSNINNLQKRRGICSSDELRDELNDLNLEACNRITEVFDEQQFHETDDSNKKTSSDSIDMDLDLSLSDINSSDINTYNENIVQKLCLSALKNIKVGNQDADIQNIQRIAVDILKEMYHKKGKHENESNTNSLLSLQRDLDTPSELLTVHDYENICAVNIAREAWGLRSWNGYIDIENWIHDGSVFRDRRRDTLTSASTEISSCISQEFKNAIMCVPPITKKAPTYSNVYVKFHDYVNAFPGDTNDETYLAKPCMADHKDLSHLEPIIEELDDLGDIDPMAKKRLNSESSLVATIDKIRKSIITNSPKSMQHRVQKSDPPHYSQSKLHNSLKRALWKEPSKFDSSNTMKSLPEKDLRAPILISELNKKRNENQDATLTEDMKSTSSGTTARRHKNPNQTQDYNKKSHSLMQHNQDISSKDIDLLWQMVTQNSLIHSTEDLQTSAQLSSTTSLQSLIQNEKKSTTNKACSKRTVKNRTRRKLTILKERFEPKLNVHSDEEMLYNCSSNTTIPSSVGVKTTNGKENGNKHGILPMSMSNSTSLKSVNSLDNSTESLVKISKKSNLYL